MSGGESYDPTLYELVHRGTPGDLDHYLHVLEASRSVLEIGCGYGRVLEALGQRRPDIELSGLDLHPGLLALARARLPEKVRLFEGDMRRALPLSGLDAVIAPYSTLWCLPSDEALSSCLRAVRESLRPGGLFAFDAYAADLFAGAEPHPDDDAPVFVAEVHDGDRGYRVFEQSTWRPEAQGFTVRYTHEPLAEGPTIEAVIEHRYVFAARLRELFEAAGFAGLELFDGFERRPWDEEADHLVGLAYVEAPP